MGTLATAGFSFIIVLVIGVAVSMIGLFAGHIMGPAIEAYLLDQYYRQRDFASLDLTRLVACLEDDSETLREILFCGLDLWAESHFDSATQISATMEAYVFRVLQCLEDRFSSGMYVGPTGLRHVELLKQYLNRSFHNERTAALWREYFPAIFKDYMRRPPFAVVFLLMMLDEEQRKTSPATQLDLAPLSLLVRCGYEYICEGDFDELSSVPFDVLCAMAEVAIKNKFYLREYHEEDFPYFVDQLLLHGVHKGTLEIIRDGDNALRSIILKCIKFMLDTAHKLKPHEKWYLLELIEKIPAKSMADFESEWNGVLTKAEQLRSK